MTIARAISASRFSPVGGAGEKPVRPVRHAEGFQPAVGNRLLFPVGSAVEADRVEEAGEDDIRTRTGFRYRSCSSGETTPIRRRISQMLSPLAPSLPEKVNLIGVDLQVIPP